MRLRTSCCGQCSDMSAEQNDTDNLASIDLAGAAALHDRSCERVDLIRHG